MEPNTKTTIWGIIFAIAGIISANPSLVGALAPETRAWVTTTAGVVLALAGAMGFAAAKGQESPKQLEEKAVKKEEEKQELKAEIHAERDEKVHEKVAAVLPSLLPTVLPQVLPTITPTVNTEAETVNVKPAPKAEVVEDEKPTP